MTTTEQLEQQQTFLVILKYHYSIFLDKHRIFLLYFI